MADIDPERTYIEPQSIIDYTVLSDQKQSCIIHKNIHKTCLEKKIEYPDISSINDKEIISLVKADIEMMSQSFQKEQLHAQLNEEEMEDRSVELYEHDTYSIFSFTPKTLTIEKTNSTYSGGAHGSYSTTFSNIDKSTKKELTLKDILKPNQEKAFTLFAEKFYRELRQLSATDSMKEAGWFNDEFTLAESFAITPEGLYFLYNSYEIQPYALGQEVILLPYDKIKKFLSTSYFDEATLKSINTLAHTYKKTFNDSLEIAVTPSKNHSIKVSVKATNTLYDTTQGWLSVSFKELKAKQVKVSLLNQNFDDFKSYPAGSKIYNKKKKKAIKSSYLLLESEAKKWKSDETKKLEFELEVPKDINHLTILLRAVQKFDNRMIEPSKEFDQGLVTGQQGHNNFVLDIEL